MYAHLNTVYQTGKTTFKNFKSTKHASSGKILNAKK